MQNQPPYNPPPQKSGMSAPSKFLLVGCAGLIFVMGGCVVTLGVIGSLSSQKATPPPALATDAQKPAQKTEATPVAQPDPKQRAKEAADSLAGAKQSLKQDNLSMARAFLSKIESTDEENYSRAGSVLVKLREDTGQREMDILDYMIRSYVPGANINFPKAAALSAAFLEAGEK